MCCAVDAALAPEPVSPFSWRPRGQDTGPICRRRSVSGLCFVSVHGVGEALDADSQAATAESPTLVIRRVERRGAANSRKGAWPIRVETAASDQDLGSRCVSVVFTAALSTSEVVDSAPMIRFTCDRGANKKDPDARSRHVVSTSRASQVSPERLRQSQENRLSPTQAAGNPPPQRHGQARKLSRRSDESRGEF